MGNDAKSENRCGMVSIVGRPNVGKSTLLNKIVGEKIAIVSKVPQTTRNQIRGVYTEERGQVIFVDTPGLHMGKDKLDKFMNRTCDSTINDTDCIIYLADTSRNIGQEEERIAAKLKMMKCPVILGLNKVDLKKNKIPEYISFWEGVKGMPVTEMKNFTLIALSGEKGDNIDQLLDVIFGYLPQGPNLYPDDVISDTPRKIVVADIIREKLIHVMRDEIPYSLGVFIEHMQPRKRNTWHIKALLMVERDTQKEIVIGKKGDILKQIGTQAREELEVLLETKVFLELHVKTQKNWRDDTSILQELGYEHY